MFDVKKENCNTITEKLLWDIWELLKKEVPLILNKESKIEETKIEVRQTIGNIVAKNMITWANFWRVQDN